MTARGSWPVLHLDASLDEHLPMSLVAFGEQTLELAKRCFDEVVLHTFFNDETASRCVQTVKRAVEQAGRDPAAVTDPLSTSDSCCCRAAVCSGRRRGRRVAIEDIGPLPGLIVGVYPGLGFTAESDHYVS